MHIYLIYIYIYSAGSVILYLLLLLLLLFRGHTLLSSLIMLWANQKHCVAPFTHPFFIYHDCQSMNLDHAPVTASPPPSYLFPPYLIALTNHGHAAAPTTLSLHPPTSMLMMWLVIHFSRQPQLTCHYSHWLPSSRGG